MMQQVREDFDHLALLMAHEREGLQTYSGQLLRHVPAGCAHALEIGCGFGSLARLTARRARRVTAIDLSAEMIKVARARSLGSQNLEFVVGDFLRARLPAESYDCILTMATLHHLPQVEALARIKSLLRPGGVLILHDLLAAGGPLDAALDVLRLPLSMAARCWQTGRFRARPAVRRAWAEHGRHETYLTIEGVRAMRDQHLPGGHVYRHFLWRYTVVWRKPETLSGPDGF